MHDLLLWSFSPLTIITYLTNNENLKIYDASSSMVKKQCEFEYLKEVTNIVYHISCLKLVSRFPRCKFKLCWSDCNVRAEVNVKKQLSQRVYFVLEKWKCSECIAWFNERRCWEYFWDHKISILFALQACCRLSPSYILKSTWHENLP